MRLNTRRRAAALLTAALAFALPAASNAQDGITLNVRDASLADVLLLIARQGHINIVPDGSLPTTRIAALNLTGLTPRIALTAVERAYAALPRRRQRHQVKRHWAWPLPA